MFVSSYQYARDFLAKTRKTLLQNEVENSLMLGIALRLRSTPRQAKKQPQPYLATVEDKQGLIVTALMTPPHNLVLYNHRDDHILALTALAHNLQEHSWSVPGVIGPKPVAENFARVWSENSGRAYKVSVRQRLFQLQHVIHSPIIVGKLRQASEKDHEIVTRWIASFLVEALNKVEIAEAPQMATARIGAGVVYLWENEHGQPVAMAMSSRPVVSVISIGMVYTPREERGKGYASSCVAALSQHLLDQGWKHCCLFTDLANPISNHIYQKMGYKPVCDFDEFAFEE